MSGQLGFGDFVVSGQRSRRKDRLGEIAGLVDWGAVEGLLRRVRPLRTGGVRLMRHWSCSRRCCCSAGTPSRTRRWEDALCDRLSFRRFVGPGLDEAIPDASTLCRFRCDLAARDLGEALFAGVGRLLDASGLLVRQGTLIDASLIATAAAEPRKQPGGGTSRVDPEAEWAKKGSKATFGYKLHIAVDQGSGLVRAARPTPARVADCTVGPELVQGDAGAVYADMGYASATMRERLEQAGIANAVMKRPNRDHRLGEADKARNAAIGRIRGTGAATMPKQRLISARSNRVGLYSLQRAGSARTAFKSCDAKLLPSEKRTRRCLRRPSEICTTQRRSRGVIRPMDAVSTATGTGPEPLQGGLHQGNERPSCRSGSKLASRKD